jgi:hypothetical protein
MKALPGGQVQRSPSVVVASRALPGTQAQQAHGQDFADLAQTLLGAHALRIECVIHWPRSRLAGGQTPAAVIRRE